MPVLTHYNIVQSPYRFRHPSGDIQYLTHLIISRHNGKPIRIGWDALQAIKFTAFGDRPCVEYFPTDEDVVDERNWRHLWEIPVELAYGLGLDLRHRQ